ncbi:MAG: oxidoreductase [Chitinophagales bacterium]
MAKDSKTALLLGASGLVGEQCLSVLLESSYYSAVTILVRKGIALKHPKLNQLVVDFDRIKDYEAEIKADDVFCCIGTTIGKAGSQAAFKKVDYYYPLQIAEIALWNGATKFILVSSLGADSHSAVFYSRVKGKLEEALKKLKFESLLIFRPSILLGNRKEKRAGEAVGRFVAEKFSFLFAGPLRKYRGTPVDLLARRMLAESQKGTKGARIYENEEILK